MPEFTRIYLRYGDELVLAHPETSIEQVVGLQELLDNQTTTHYHVCNSSNWAAQKVITTDDLYKSGSLYMINFQNGNYVRDNLTVKFSSEEQGHPIYFQGEHIQDNSFVIKPNANLLFFFDDIGFHMIGAQKNLEEGEW